MQNFDEIKRMADMARTMRERGLAKDSIDAMNQARSATSSDPSVLQARKEEVLQERIALLERKFDQSQRRIEELQTTLDAANKRLADTVTLLTNVNTKLRDLEQSQANAQLAQIPTPHWEEHAQWQQPAQQPAPAQQPWQQPAQQWQQPAQEMQWAPQHAAQYVPPPQERYEAPQPLPSTKPIDRNNVAPSEISVEKFFYFGNKR